MPSCFSYCSCSGSYVCSVSSVVVVVAVASGGVAAGVGAVVAGVGAVVAVAVVAVAACCDHDCYNSCAAASTVTSAPTSVTTKHMWNTNKMTLID